MKDSLSKTIFLSAALVLLLLNASCTQQPLSPGMYMAWVQNTKNGLNTTKTAGDFMFSLQYKPLEYVVMLNERKNNIDKATLEKGLGEINDMQYYTFRINSKDASTEMLRTNLSETNEYFKRVEYFSFHLKDDIYLVDGKDSLPCALFHFERSYALSPDNNFVIAFPLTQNEVEQRKSGKKYTAEKTLVYNDRFLNTGTVKLSITKNAIENIPGVKL